MKALLYGPAALYLYVLPDGPGPQAKLRRAEIIGVLLFAVPE